MAEKILFDGKRATGVRYRRHGQSIDALAGREVIVAAGAINGPQLLQLSGIGPTALLRDRGIDIVQANENVGSHLQDHLCYDHVYRANRPTLNNQLLPWSGRLQVGLQYLLTRSGPLTLSVNQGGGFFRAKAGSARPDTQLYFSPLSYERALPGVRAMMKPDPFPGFCTSISPCRPTSRGSVRIRSSDPNDPPAIEPNMMATDDDVANLLAGAHFLRKLAATPTFRSVIEAELKPGPATQSDDEFIADVRARAYSVFHPVGTCRMGPDARDSVVDPTLKLHGVGGLRVTDASIFPTVTSGNTNAPAIMVGEKGAELVLRDSN
jgi:choline dehydrogenase